MLHIDLRSSESITSQIHQGIRREIAAGALRPGHELPTVRQLAADLGTSLNTVARAYRLLEADGLVAAVRGRGTVVLEHARSAKQVKNATERKLAEQLRDVLTNARLAGWSWQRLEKLLSLEAANIWPEERKS